MIVTTITGRLTKDPEVRQAGNSNVVNFSVAVNTSAKDANGNYVTNFYECEWFGGKLGEQFALKAQKGTVVSVTGESIMIQYFSQKNQCNMTKLTLKATKAECISNMRTDAAPAAKATTAQRPAQPVYEEPDF